MLVIKCTMYNAVESLKQTRLNLKCEKSCGVCPMLKITSDLPKGSQTTTHAIANDILNKVSEVK